MTVIDTPGAVTMGPPTALKTAAPNPVTGPTPTSSERRAAQERLDLAPDRDVAAAATLAHRLGQLAKVCKPYAARELAHRLTAVVNLAVAEHGPCAVVGCPACLYLTDAAATVQAWKDGPS